MKVLFLANLPSPYRALFFAELGKLCDLTVIYERESASDRNKKWKVQTEKTYRAIFLKGKQIGADNSLCPEIISYLRKKKYDKYVVGMYSTLTAMLAITFLKKNHLPFYLSTDGGFIQDDSVIKFKIKKHFIGAASRWLCPSDDAIDYFVHYGADRKKTYKYPFTSLMKKDIDEAAVLAQSDKSSLRSRLGMCEKYILLSVGRFSYDAGYGKGYDTLMEVAKKLRKDIGIYIVGDEPTDEFVKWRKNENLYQVHFIGFKEKKELAQYYAAADAFILLTKKDVWGLVINEAMSFGLPIITTKQCLAGLELVHQGMNGFLVEAGDAQAALDAVEECFSDEERRIEMGIRSSKIIENYSIENMAYRHFLLLDKQE